MCERASRVIGQLGEQGLGLVVRQGPHGQCTVATKVAMSDLVIEISSFRGWREFFVL